MPLVLTGPQPTPTEYRPPYVNFPPRATPYSAGPRRFLDQLRFRNLFCHRHDLRQSYISGRLRTHFLLFLRFQMLHLIDILVTSHQKSHSFLGIAVCGVPPPYCTGSQIGLRFARLICDRSCSIAALDAHISLTLLLCPAVGNQVSWLYVGNNHHFAHCFLVEFMFTRLLFLNPSVQR